MLFSKSLLFFILTTIFAGIIPGLAQKKPKRDVRNPIWSDEFNRDGVPSEWTFDIGEPGNDGWGLAQKQCYTDKNAKVQNGSLIIQARKENLKGCSYSSSRIRSKHRFKPSVIEIRAKLPKGIGLWTAFWLFGGNPWPKTGDLDILEHLGMDPNIMYASFITNKFNNANNNKQSGFTNVKDPYNEFHIYKLDWNSKRVRFLVDDVKYFEYVNDGKNDYATWPYNGFTKPFQFNGEYSLILNLGVGGTFISNGKSRVNQVDDSVFPKEVVIDYIRQYAPNN